MAQRKAHEVDQWLQRPGPEAAVVLVYGPDHGLVVERARAFAEGSGLPLDDPFTVVRMDAPALEKEPGRLSGEARTIPMFAARRMLWVRDAGSQRSLAEEVKSLLAEPAPDCVILVEAGDLKKTAPLRAVVEASPRGMALPCYEDDEAAIDRVIDQELAAAGKVIAEDARAELRRALGGDRLATRSEVAKLALYAGEAREIGLADVRALAGDVSAVSLDDAIDAALVGQSEAADRHTVRVTQQNAQAVQLLAALLRHLQMLQAVRAAAGERSSGIGAAVGMARPPIHFSRRRAVERAVALWPAAALERALERVQAAILTTRRRADLSRAVARQTLLALAAEAAARGR